MTGTWRCRKTFSASSWACFLLAVLWALLLPGSIFGEEPTTAGKNYEKELLQLTEISTRLGKLNEQLKNELENSRKSSSELETRLSESRTELEQLRAELEALQNNSNELRQSAEISLKESVQLKDSLQKTEDSLKSLEQSFNDYKLKAEKELNQMEQSRKLYRFLAIVMATLAVSGWAALGLSLLF